MDKHIVKKILDIEQSLRDCELSLNAGLRHVDCIRNEDYFLLMEKLGFLNNNKFLSIINIIKKTKPLNNKDRILTLEAVACDLSNIAKYDW